MKQLDAPGTKVKKRFHAVKFRTEFASGHIPDEDGIEELKRWCSQFHRLNLAAPHKYGSYGNLSFRVPGKGFVITASGAHFSGELTDRDFVLVRHCNFDDGIVIAEGAKEPSSESMLHYSVYSARADVNAVFHGHSREILARAEELGLKETRTAEPYGTVALAKSLLEVLDDLDFILLKKHGFISCGRTMNEAGTLALDMVQKATGQDTSDEK